MEAKVRVYIYDREHIVELTSKRIQFSVAERG